MGAKTTLRDYAPNLKAQPEMYKYSVQNKIPHIDKRLHLRYHNK